MMDRSGGNVVDALRAAGQSVWLDHLDRALLDRGDLERLIYGVGVTGVTSNPSIFKKALADWDSYEPAFRALGPAELSANELFADLALADVMTAADLLRATYDDSAGTDGFVSFQLDPRWAHDETGQIAEATRIFELLERPNVMIKIYGTAEGAHALEELIARGVNVNVTLLFSVDRYQRVAEGYIAGLQRRAEAGVPVDAVASVASFFVSRVDTAVDARLPAGSPLRGAAAIANAKIAYQRFKSTFAGPIWDTLGAAGARPQRPLWASTGTKDPAYSDVRYVEELIGPNTVNTMPVATLGAFRDHGTVRPHAVEEGVEQANEEMRALSEIGIDIDEVTETLLEDGIAAFAEDLASVLATLDEKMQHAA